MSRVDYKLLIRKLVVPHGTTIPRRLAFDDIVAVALTREHLRDDVDGINASLDVIRRTRGGPWPAEAVTEEGDYIDLVWHECEFPDDSSFTYVLQHAAGRYLGCAYL